MKERVIHVHEVNVCQMKMQNVSILKKVKYCGTDFGGNFISSSFTTGSLGNHFICNTYV